MQRDENPWWQVFAKNANWNNDLYSGLVAKVYGADMWCETWMRGVSLCVDKLASFHITLLLLHGAFLLTLHGESAARCIL